MEGACFTFLTKPMKHFFCDMLAEEQREEREREEL